MCVFVNADTSSSQIPVLGLKASINDCERSNKSQTALTLHRYAYQSTFLGQGKEPRAAAVISCQFCYSETTTKEKALQDSPQGDNN